jgi:hypothetical protein
MNMMLSAQFAPGSILSRRFRSSQRMPVRPCRFGSVLRPASFVVGDLIGAGDSPRAGGGWRDAKPCRPSSGAGRPAGSRWAIAPRNGPALARPARPRGSP